ncbi:hypothetical protein [Colwellia psychrerythraea]|uniref:PEP motif anchor domain protein n=1 Tax=Colwellia psychrerythraea TaxID=28229 RepID=A0A099KM91_COLPS|nr:hypothetical protein [Colwellia psychrerythraea]KGJ91884.1 hypothetical protein GAB14E_3041 [Colwellia psychrerythraea]
MIKLSKILLAGMLSLSALTLPSVVQANLIGNGDFSNNLNGYDSWNVEVSGEQAMLNDADFEAELSQGVAIDSSISYLFEFDFVSNIAAPDPQGFSDMFITSLYFSVDNVLDVFSDDFIGLLDIDGYGIAYDESFALDPSSTSATFSFEFSVDDLLGPNNIGYVFIDFLLFDNDGIWANSTVSVDNISLTAAATAIPTPSSILLMLLALGLMAYRKNNYSR